MPEQDHGDNSLLGMIDKRLDVDLADEVLTAEIQGSTGKDRQRDDTGHDMRDVKREGAPPDFQAESEAMLKRTCSP